ncbi:DUF2934 domain-containing protein [Sinorhizobium sp. 7-81]|uniref:DUF2934 domain-containing protein n=1 Tax=Sinorhizobium sp. 8-89 TaxID=3049089 RepID=UPI0024C34446|nr:DUF2934 domain-containing protein [Sinorhizobium sp. 8-89]MDK1494478.1 DUF2934 domain-containing protein [Sinorhizobium sp. 8-89]
MKTDEEELIRTRAYELWERAGRPEGDGLEHWFEAANEVQSAKINGVEVLKDAAVPGGTIESTVVTQARTPKSTVTKQPDSAKRLKRSTVSKTTGDKKGKRTEGR